MCLSPPVPADIDACSTDEERILFLGRRRVGDPIPRNVTTEVNPFSIEPWEYSPEGTWFLYDSKGTQHHSGDSIIKVTGNCYWKYCDDLRISTSTTTVGRKTTREFYIGKAPFGDKTGWMMHQYQAENIAMEGNNKGQDSSLCRLYRISTSTASPKLSDPVGVEPMLMRDLGRGEINSLGDAANETQVVGEDNQRRLPPQDLVPPHDILNVNSEDDLQGTYDGDFLELKDLDSSSMSSDNSSLMSVNSDDYFDGEALLRDIENESNPNMDENRVNHRYNISTSVRSNQVVIRPPASAAGSGYNSSSNLVVSESGSANAMMVPKPSLSSSMDPHSNRDASVSGSSKDSQVNETRSGSSDGTSSSRGSGSRSIRRIAKLGKRYCCFAQF